MADLLDFYYEARNIIEGMKDGKLGELKEETIKLYEDALNNLINRKLMVHFDTKLNEY